MAAADQRSRNKPEPDYASGMIWYAVGDRLAFRIIQDVAPERLKAYFERSWLSLIDLQRIHEATIDDLPAPGTGCGVRIATCILETSARIGYFTRTVTHP